MDNFDCELPVAAAKDGNHDEQSAGGGCNHGDQRKSRSYDAYFVHAAGTLCPIILPVVHIYITYQLFGNYEAGVSTYKHVYFNSTSNTFKIWTITVIGVLLAYECSRYLCALAFAGRLRLRMLVLWASVIYPHYYSWWAYFNYWNDEFYSQWYHQMYFTVTEAVSTMAVLRLADSRHPLLPRLLLVVLNVSVAHIVVSGFDQLVANVVKGDGSLHQITRDLGFFLPDLIHTMIAVNDLCGVSRSRHRLSRHVISNGDFVGSVLFVLLSLLLCLYL